MEQCGGDCARVELEIGNRLCGVQRMRDCRVPALAQLPGVPLGRKRIRFLNEIHAFRREIGSDAAEDGLPQLLNLYRHRPLSSVALPSQFHEELPVLREFVPF